MAKFKKRKLKEIFKPVHLHTIIFLVIYFIFSNAVFVSLVTLRNIYEAIIGILIFGSMSGFLFLYLFSHEDFFAFAGVLEKEESKKEKNYLDKFLKYGRFLTCVLVSQVGGPIFLALTVRFLFRKKDNRYLIVFLASAVSAVFGVLLAKGLLNFF